MGYRALSTDEGDFTTRDLTNIDYSAKFGGSSVANADRMIEVFKLVKE